MQNLLLDPVINFEEKRTLKWFLALFYVILVSFDLFYDFFIPKFITHTTASLPNPFSYWMYFLLLTLILVAYFLYKRDKLYLVKYVYFICYTVLAAINELIIHFDKPGPYSSGNVAEIFWLLLSPIFVSNRFFKVVSIGILLKYIMMGVILRSPNVLFPILVLAILSGLSFILLNRFQSYVQAVKTTFDHQLVGIVKGVIATLELKDPYTRGHSERVAAYALMLAKEMGTLSSEELKSFNYACLLHDIGKVHIPDNILSKPTSLTKEEYEIIKTHPIVGADAVSRVDGIKGCIEVIRFHHERWDGKGYPDQLQGEEIPFLARVTAVADAFDAMTSSRSYRSALTADEAAKRIIDGKGTQFDPNLVDLFIKVYPKWKEIQAESSYRAGIVLPVPFTAIKFGEVKS